MLLFNDEDKRELLEEVPIYNVCDFLGIEYQNTGCRKSILCPDHLNHNDQHYGSCFIYENTNTAHCFVCNKSFDTIDLLRLNGYGYYDALCQLANLSGSLSRFEKQPDKKQFWLPNLTKEERELIGLYPTKRIKLYYAIQENKPDDRKYDIIFGKEGEDDSFLLYKTLKYNPWFMLQEKNPEGYLSMVLHVVFELYEEAGVFNACDKPDWKETTPELSKKVNFHSIYRRMEEKKAEMEGKRSGGNDTKDAYARLLERLSCFAREYSIECKLYGTSDGIGIDDLIGDDDVTVLESKGLENTFKNFIFGVITSGFYKYAVAHEGGFLADDQYETVLVIEEANEVLIGTDTSKGDNVSLSGESEFEQILDQSAGYGLFVFAITQKIADMPSSIIANAGIVFAGKLKRPEDISVVVRAVGREERIDDRDLVKWFPRSPIGYFVCQTSRSFDFKDAEPVLVQISRLNINPPSNLELDEIILQKEIKQHLKEIA